MPDPICDPIGGLRAHHVSIAVPDIERAVAFWTDLFGFAVDKRFEVPAIGGKGAFLKSSTIRIELWELAGGAPVPPQRRQPNSDLLTAGTKHLAFSVADLPAALDALRSRGIAIVAVQRSPGGPMRMEDADVHGPAFAAFIHDPFGTLIELLGPEAE